MPVKRAKPTSVSIDTTLTAFGNNTGVVAARELIEALGAGQRPAVVVDANRGPSFRLHVRFGGTLFRDCEDTPGGILNMLRIVKDLEGRRGRDFVE
jgi:hypothetical protein